jgi:hypothetical protein
MRRLNQIEAVLQRCADRTPVDGAGSMSVAFHLGVPDGIQQVIDTDTGLKTICQLIINKGIQYD